MIDSRTCEGGRAIRRRRQCEKCDKRFTTYERVEQVTRLMVVKRDGRRVPWDRDKILQGLERACFKRPVPEAEIIRVADEVEEEVFNVHDREVQTESIGRLLMDKLRRLDQVAYVRFASVYRQFKTLEELVEEARAVLDARRYEDPPGQGRLFVDPATGIAEPEDAAPQAVTGDAPPANGRPRKGRRVNGSATDPEPAGEASP